MNYWLISDTHFNHEKLTEWGGRSGDWQDQLLRGLAEIPHGDTLIHLGDINIGNDALVHDMLFSKEGYKHPATGEMLRFGVLPSNVRKILVRGNHDKKGVKWYEEHGWDFVVDGMELIYEGNYLHFTHRPARPQGNNTFNIHGHTHGNMHRAEEFIHFYDPAYHIDISPEFLGYKPVRLDSLLKAKKLGKLKQDHEAVG